ncbi:glycoside hydrolase family 3 protein [Luteimonas sp. RIT-PG2_3]
MNWTRRPTAPLAVRLLATVLALSLAACGGAAHRPAESESAATADAEDVAITPAHWPEVEWPFAHDAALEARVDALLASMTVEEKVGQIVQGDLASITPEDVRKYRLGSILAGGSSDPGGRYDASPADWLAVSDAFWEASMDTRGGGKAIPLIFGIDAMHGQSNVVGATLFPHNIGLGATRNPELIRKIGEITAIETRTTGMEWAFAPTVAVPQDDRWGRSYEGYSEDPALVASFAGAMVEGLQGKVGSADFLGERRVMVSVKHFVGDGGTSAGKDQGDTIVSEAVLRDVHGAGYVPAIAAGAQSVMASFNSFHGRKLHGHKALLTDVLKDRMNFGGFVVGDWNGHGQIPGCSNENCPATILAGLDMAMAPDSWKGFYESALTAAKNGSLPMARLDDAVRRILRVKFRLGLFDAPKPSQRALGARFELLGSPGHRAVARQAVRESLVLLKNANGLLPLSPAQRVLVAGDGANDMGKQSGGWTLNWQGTGTKRADYPNGTTVHEGIAAQVERAGGQAVLSIDGRYSRKPDVAIVVFGEDPYAEFQGDIPTLLYKPGDDRDLALIKRLKADGIPVVAVFLSGRPLWMNREINASDAFVAAWLPGSEGEGIADVLLRDTAGKVQHDFHGKLAFSWPRRGNQYVNNIDQHDYDPLFAYGFGLRYADNGNLATLPEDPGVTAGVQENGRFFVRGVPRGGIEMRLTAADGSQTTAQHVPARSTDGALAITAVDHNAQEDARKLAWSGNATFAMVSPEVIDIDRETNGDVLLVATMRIDGLPVGEATLYAGCGPGCGGELPIGPWLASLPRDKWITAAVPLKCLRSAGVDVSRLDAPLGIRSTPGLSLSLSQVVLGTDAEYRLSCRRD